MTLGQSHGASRFRQGLPWSLSFRSSMRKRTSSRGSRPPTPSPTCEERIHYPVFNPHDPRHNPAATFPLWIRNHYRDSEDSSDTLSTARWMQSLPQRSLRKARSGILAFGRSRSRAQNHRRDIPRSWLSFGSNGSSDAEDTFFPSTISEASTENEHEFGTDLYRTRCNGSSTWDFKIVEDFWHGSEARSAYTPINAVPPGVDICPVGLRLEGETLNGNEEEAPIFNLPQPPPKRPTIKWDDANINRVPSRPTTSGSVSPSSATVSSNASGLSHVVDANQALEALCLLDRSTVECREDEDTECSDEDFVPEPPPNGTTFSSDEAMKPKDSTEGNTQRLPVADIEAKCTSLEESTAELPTGDESNVTSSALDHASPMEGPGDSSSSTGQDTRSGHSSYNEGDSSSVPTSWSTNQSYQNENEARFSLPPLDLDDEYANDTQSSHFRPDQGGKPTEQDLDFDQSQPDRTQEHVTELIGPSDSTDDCFLTYTMFQQRYCS